MRSGAGETEHGPVPAPSAGLFGIRRPSLFPQLLFQPFGVRDFDDADDVHAAKTKGLERRGPSRFHDPIRLPRLTHTRGHD